MNGMEMGESAVLSGANLTEVKLTRTILCETEMPDGTMNNSNCLKIVNRISPPNPLLLNTYSAVRVVIGASGYPHTHMQHHTVFNENSMT